MSENKTCSRCQSTRIARVTAKCSDLCYVKIEGVGEHDGYAPTDMGIGTKDTCGDYVEFSWCLDCGQIQGRWPVKQTEIEKAAKKGKRP